MILLLLTDRTDNLRLEITLLAMAMHILNWQFISDTEKMLVLQACHHKKSYNEDEDNLKKKEKRLHLVLTLLLDKAITRDK